MKQLLPIALVLISTLSSGCGEIFAKKADAEDLPQPNGNGGYSRIPTEPLEFYSQEETGLAYSQTETSSSAWIFLVAGSLRGANFAQEVIEQKKMWMERGATESEIACYYVIPDKVNFDSDAAQYRSLAVDLQKCKLANAGAIANDIARSAESNVGNLYLYITSHGDRPLSVYVENAKTESERNKLNWLVESYPVLDNYMLSIDSIPSGSAAFPGQLDGIDAGIPAEEIFLTSASLNKMLAVFAPEVEKIVVLQGCYSGGFISDGNPKYQNDVIGNTPNVTAITAARNDRPSFGCGTGDDKTFFGGALLETLKGQESKLPNLLDWSSIYEATKMKVEALEAAKEFKPSEPQYFTNRNSGN